MWRVILQPALLFATPFVLYVAYLLTRRRFPFLAEFWTRGVLSTLTIAGLAVAVLGVFVFGLLSPREQGAYVPAHVENGKLQPGRFQ
jgi:hypothetical protein